jgi:small subunit ribosomal protein S7
MPRRARPAKRPPLPDPRYHSATVTRIVNRLMLCGKKRTAEGIVYSALELLEKQTQRDAVTALEQAIKNVTPLLEVKPRRVGGATYQVPVEVRPERGSSLAIRWLIISARSRKGHGMREKLAAEFSEAFQNQGPTVKKREDTHKMAEANRAFAHYRW